MNAEKPIESVLDKLNQAARDYNPPVKSATLKDKVLQLLPGIDNAINAGMSWSEIVNLLSQSGINISSNTLAQYYRELKRMSRSKSRPNSQKKARKTPIDMTSNTKTSASEIDYSSMRAPDPIYPVEVELVN